MSDSNEKNNFSIGNFVEYTPGDYKKPKGSCLLDWAQEYCIEGEKYKVIDANDTDIRVKGKLNPNAQLGQCPDEIWVCAIQFKIWEDSNIPEQKIKMTCEIGGCQNTEGKDYTRKEPEPLPGWEGEPIFLCDHHAQKKGYLDIPEQKKYPVGRYAPGNYSGKCVSCGASFRGDKRASQCEPCGTKSQNEFDSLTPEQQVERGKEAMRLYNELVHGKTVDESLAAIAAYNKEQKPQCTCVPGVASSTINCPIHAPYIPISKEGSDYLFKQGRKFLAAHKTRQPVINEVDKGIIRSIELVKPVADMPAFDGERFDATKMEDELRFPAPKNNLLQAWTFEILAYCSSLGISPDELIEEHQKSKSIIEALSSQIEFLGEKMAKKNSIE